MIRTAAMLTLMLLAGCATTAPIERDNADAWNRGYESGYATAVMTSPDVSISTYALSPCVPTQMALPSSRPPTAEEAMREVQRSRDSLRRCIRRHDALIEQTKAALGTIRNDDD